MLFIFMQALETLSGAFWNSLESREYLGVSWILHDLAYAVMAQQTEFKSMNLIN